MAPLRGVIVGRQLVLARLCAAFDVLNVFAAIALEAFGIAAAAAAAVAAGLFFSCVSTYSAASGANLESIKLFGCSPEPLLGWKAPPLRCILLSSGSLSRMPDLA
ncbi:hypothetical protein BDV23DRAFT_183516 [Aspergillus alliaceus]|uniref:Uncharacterized protein n=1 Tax=Petromyces alliaceus TaxID=209559 RepID=A0A5N7C8D9_PETAA|nr:hypothetical protein BDV23DRAFT_183516 [Aspergillus alliaceus]